MISQNIKRSLKDSFLYSHFIILMFIMFYLIYTAMFSLMLPKNRVYSQINSIMLIILPMFVFMNFLYIQVLCLKKAISFSSTRKSFFIATQILKFIHSIEFFLIFLCCVYIMSVLFKTYDYLNFILDSKLVFIAGLLFLSCLGEFFGNIMAKFGLIAFIIMLFIIIIVSGGVGALSGIGLYRNFNILDLLDSFNFNLIIIIVFIVLGVLLSIIDWFQLKKYCVK